MSKELEVLEYFIETIRMFGENQIGLDKFEERYKIIKQALTKSQEQEKVLEILFEKNVDIIMIRMSETLDGRLHLSSKVFEREEIIGALHVLSCMMLDDKNQDCDYDIYKDELCKMIFELIQQRNTLKGKLKRWLDLLSQDGKNTKLQVKNEIKAVLEGMEE